MVRTKAGGVMESENFKILWDFTVQCDRKIEAGIIDIAIPGDDRMKDKEYEKVEKYQLILKDEVAKVWRMQKVIEVPVVIARLELSQLTSGNT